MIALGNKCTGRKGCRGDRRQPVERRLEGGRNFATSNAEARNVWWNSVANGRRMGFRLRALLAARSSIPPAVWLINVSLCHRDFASLLSTCAPTTPRTLTRGWPDGVVNLLKTTRLAQPWPELHSIVRRTPRASLRAARFAHAKSNYRLAGTVFGKIGPFISREIFFGSGKETVHGGANVSRDNWDKCYRGQIS